MSNFKEKIIYVSMVLVLSIFFFGILIIFSPGEVSTMSVELQAENYDFQKRVGLYYFDENILVQDSSNIYYIYINIEKMQIFELDILSSFLWCNECNLAKAQRQVRHEIRDDKGDIYKKFKGNNKITFDYHQGKDQYTLNSFWYDEHDEETIIIEWISNNEFDNKIKDFHFEILQNKPFQLVEIIPYTNNSFMLMHSESVWSRVPSRIYIYNNSLFDIKDLSIECNFSQPERDQYGDHFEQKHEYTILDTVLTKDKSELFDFPAFLDKTLNTATAVECLVKKVNVLE